MFLVYGGALFLANGPEGRTRRDKGDLLTFLHPQLPNAKGKSIFEIDNVEISSDDIHLNQIFFVRGFDQFIFLILCFKCHFPTVSKVSS